MSSLVTEESHYYDLFGNPCHTQPDGSFTTKEQAIAQELFPSVNGIIGGISQIYLERWKAKQVVNAVNRSRPRQPRESEKAYYERIFLESEQELRDAAAWGSRVHQALEDHLLRSEPIPAELMPYVENGLRWLDEHVESILGVEEVVVVPNEGYAGTVDLPVKLKATSPLVMVADGVVNCVADWKNKKTHPRYPVNPDKKYQMQMSAYGKDYFNGEPFVGVNLVMSRTEPGRFDELVYLPSAMERAYTAFLAQRDVFVFMEEWDPRTY